MEKQKVCIIGGGLTGLITAACLSKLNLKVDLITENIIKGTKTNRTTAISQDNFDNLMKLKILEYPEKSFWPCVKMKLYTENLDNKFSEIFELNNDKKQILYMLNNDNIRKLIIKNLKKEKLVTFKSQNKVSKIISSGLLKSLKFNKVDNSRYSLIILCTGNNSDLSKNFFQNENFKHEYGEVSITTIIKHKSLKNNIVRQIFFDNEILALLPISNKKTSIVWSIKKDLITKYEKEKEFFFQKKIMFYAKNFLKETKCISKMEFRNLNLFIRKKYFKDRVLLFGDALHVVHPFVGQGFNMALRDLVSLEKILKNKIKLGLDVGGSDILSEFSLEVKPRNFVYSMGIDFIKNIFSVRDKKFKKLRDLFITKLNKNNFAKNLFFNLADKGLKF